MGWGSSMQTGRGQKVRALPRKFVFLGFEGGNLVCPGNFAGMSRTPAGVQKLCTKKVCAYFSFPKRSGEGVVRRNGCPKECFWRVRFFSAPLRFSGV